MSGLQPFELIPIAFSYQLAPGTTMNFSNNPTSVSAHTSIARTHATTTPVTTLTFPMKQTNDMFSIQSKFTVPYRLTLYPNEVFRLPQAGHLVRVLSGIAWLTVAGEDIILTSNEAALLLPHQETAVISVLRNKPLILEVR